MADRSFHEGPQALEVGTVTLWAKMVVGATGAVTSGTGKGITSITRDDVGKYTVLFQDKYTSLLFADAKVLDATLETPATVGIYANMFSEAVAASGSMIFQFIAMDDGAAADPAEGAIVYFKIELKNSSV